MLHSPTCPFVFTCRLPMMDKFLKYLSSFTPSAASRTWLLLCDRSTLTLSLHLHLSSAYSPGFLYPILPVLLLAKPSYRCPRSCVLSLVYLSRTRCTLFRLRGYHSVPLPSSLHVYSQLQLQFISASLTHSTVSQSTISLVILV